VHNHDNDPADLHHVVVELVKHSPRRVKRAILALLDHRDAQRMATPPPPEPGPPRAQRGDPVIRDPEPDPRYPDESEDEPDLSAPIGDRQYVLQPLLDNDGKPVTFSGTDRETGEVVTGTAPLTVDPALFKEAARRRGVDTDA
jgi:hypothetical protein